MKFLHTADLHIGRLFHGISLLDEQKQVLQQIIDTATREKIDALLIAGDVYDRNIPPVEAITLLEWFVNELTLKHRIPVIMISGNHDSAGRLGFANKQMAQGGLHVFSSLEQILSPVVLSRDESADFASEKVHIYGIPFCTPSEVNKAFEQAFSSYDQAHTFLVERITQQITQQNTQQITQQNTQQNTPSVKNILLSHCFMLNAESSDSERTLSVGGSDRVSAQPCAAFDYVALGHLHRPQAVGFEHIRYSGSLMKYSFSEHLHDKGVTLLDTNQQTIKIEHVALTPARDTRVISGKLKDLILQGKTDPKADDYVLARLTNTESLLDPMNQLRAVYPNALQIERLEKVSATPGESSREKLSRSSHDLFADFYASMTDEGLSQAEQDLVNLLLDEISLEPEFSYAQSGDVE